MVDSSIPAGSARGRAGALARVLLAAAGALAALSASCREATTKPELGVTVGVAQLVGPTLLADSIGRQLIECDPTLVARDGNSRRALWDGATFSFYAAGDSTTVLASQSVPAETVQESWGDYWIYPDSVATARWRITAGIPYRVKMEYYYQLDGGWSDSTSVSVTCAPSVTPGAPPVITNLQVRPDTAVGPGDTLSISYAATSTTGLWQSVIQLSGACDTTLLFAEEMRASADRLVTVVVPAACRLGYSLTVTAYAYDAALQSAVEAVYLGALVDRRRPVVSGTVTTPNTYGTWASLAAFNGYILSSNVLSMNVTASDNHLLHAAYWDLQPAGFRDSLPLNLPSIGAWTVTLTAKNAWAGPQQLRLWATDASGNVSDTAETAPGALDVVPMVGPAPNLIDLPDVVADVLFDSKRGVYYLLENDAYKIAVFSPASGTVVDSIAMTDYASTIDLSPSGDSIVTVLMNSGALGIVDLTQPTPALAAVPLPGLDSGFRLLDVKVAATGTAVLAAQHIWSTPSPCTGTCLYTYSLGAGTGRFRLDAPVLAMYTTGFMARSGDGSSIVINADSGKFLRYDAATDAFGPPHASRLPGMHPSVDSTGAHVVVGGDLYDGSLQFVRTMRAALANDGLGAISADGQTHYLSEGPDWVVQGIIRSRVSDGGIVDHMPLPLLITLLRASPDGSTLVAVEGRVPSVIAVINLGQLRPTDASAVRPIARASPPRARARPPVRVPPPAGPAPAPRVPFDAVPPRASFRPHGG